MPITPSTAVAAAGAFVGTGGSGKMFSVYQTRDGDLVMSSGWLIAIRAGVQLQVGTSGATTLGTGTFGDTWTPQPGSIFVGGSGRNLVIADVDGSDLPGGFLRPGVDGEWSGVLQPDLKVIWDEGDGSGVITDGTNNVATAPAASFTFAPVGTFTATTYGEDEYNGGDPFTVTTDWEGGAPIPGATLEATTSLIDPDTLTATTTQAYDADTLIGWTLTIAGDGSAVISDGTDDVAERPAGDLLSDPTGVYASTTYGAANYGDSGDPFTILVNRATAAPLEGWIYLKVTESAPGVPSAVDGPFFATALPANADPIYYVPIAYSDGAGGIDQIQEGAILWGGGGGAGESIPWVTISSADYLALDPPDPDTIYDIDDVLP